MTNAWSISYETDVSGLFVDDEDMGYLSDAIISQMDRDAIQDDKWRILLVGYPVCIYEDMEVDIRACVVEDPTNLDQIADLKERTGEDVIMVKVRF